MTARDEHSAEKDALRSIWRDLAERRIELGVDWPRIVRTLFRDLDAAEAALDQEIANRDNAQEWADRLAYAIAPVGQIGEHTSHNSPWENALEIALSTRVTPPGVTS